jgi:prepilin signal peptidase PulO-like enzyme (type II secretory pathway)
MGGSKALSTATFLCGLIAIIILAAIVVWYVLARNGAMDFDTMFTLARILQPLAWVMMLAGLASIVLGIVTLVMAGKNPALNKPKAIIGMCMGVISLVVYFTLVGMTIGY